MTSASTSPDQPNAQQIEEWNGRVGERWVLHQDRLDRMLAPMSAAVLSAAALKSGEQVLDIGCGCGATTLEAARILGPNGHVTGVDISDPMVKRARERATAAKIDATFNVADAATYHFKAAQFDAMISRFGVMFFDNPPAAFANIRASLKATGRMAFVCWRSMPENDWLGAPLKAAMPFLPPMEKTEPGAPGPFAFADRDRLNGILSEAGFRSIRIEAHDEGLTMGTSANGDAVDDALVQAMEIGPLSRMLAKQPDDIRQTARTAVREALLDYVTPQGVVMSGAVWIVTAKA
ncbi:MAG: methyltransferase domain-containing protein [Rhizobiales bacterium]|nr:methyltransferase domain-containing protein [Hyphomicrobiales bacterium]